VIGAVIILLLSECGGVGRSTLLRDLSEGWGCVTLDWSGVRLPVAPVIPGGSVPTSVTAPTETMIVDSVASLNAAGALAVVDAGQWINSKEQRLAVESAHIAWFVSSSDPDRLELTMKAMCQLPSDWPIPIGFAVVDLIDRWGGKRPNDRKLFDALIVPHRRHEAAFKAVLAEMRENTLDTVMELVRG